MTIPSVALLIGVVIMIVLVCRSHIRKRQADQKIREALWRRDRRIETTIK